jgi:hypothetical protein
MLGDTMLMKIVLGVVIGFVAIGPFSVALNWPITTVNVVIDLPPPAPQ